MIFTKTTQNLYRFAHAASHRAAGQCSRPLAICLAISLAACTDPVNAPVAPQSASLQAVAVSGCGAKAVRISEVQGSGALSPIAGSTVTIEAVVTSPYLSAVGGVFVQEERDHRDGDPATSEGLVILLDQSKVAKPGDLVRVTGLVTEFGDEPGKSVTALKDLTEFLSCGSAPLPAMASIEQAPVVQADWERFEAMRVSLDLPVTVVRNDRLESDGELQVSLSGRQFQPTEIHPPGEEARRLNADNLRNRLILDDGQSAFFPKTISWLSQRISQETPYRVGTRLGEVEGFFDERGGSYRVHVAKPPVVEQAPRPKQPASVKGELEVLSFNLENWFNGDGKGAGFPTSRGAVSKEAMLRQRNKLVTAIAATAPDIAALIEVENDGDQPKTALQELVDALNAQTQLGYVWVVPPGAAAKARDAKLGGDEIRVAMIYRKSKVRTKGDSATISGAPFDRLNRPPLAQTFERLLNGKGTGQVFTLVANHWKSKGGCDPSNTANVDRGDFQACWNPVRVEAARAIMDWLATDPTKSLDPDYLVVGDFNAYSQEDPLRLMVAAGFMRLAEGTRKAPSYSFSFNGSLGKLDHAFASSSLKSQIADADIWHINADEYPGFAYDAAEFADPLQQTRAQAANKLLYRKHSFRTSDHDPLLIGLNLDADAVPTAPASTQPVPAPARAPK